MELIDKNLYYVGGIVRDSILQIPSLDTDYCYEGNAIKFAKKFNVIKTNRDFGTVRVDFDGEQVDIASTRTESYPRKGHLPVIDKLGCPLEEDLKRRDFSINAMAIRTTDNELIDYFHGMDDINNNQLRVLHNESFIDDPTRIVRGLKFSVRFDFELEKETLKLQEEYLENINYDMSYHRLKKELIETFSLNSQKAFDIFIKQGIYKLLGENQEVPHIETSIQELVTKYPSKHSWLVYLGLFDLSNFELTKAEKKIVEWAQRLKTQKPNNNTPFESLLIHRLRIERKSLW